MCPSTQHILKEDTAAVEKFFNGISSSNGTIDMEAKKFVYRGVQFTEQFLEVRISLVVSTLFQ